MTPRIKLQVKDESDVEDQRQGPLRPVLEADPIGRLLVADPLRPLLEQMYT